jgi:hypothetical protein
MQFIHVLMAILGSWRLVEVAMFDEIFAPIRKLCSRFQWLKLFWQCPKCVSVWVGAASTIAFFYFPFLNWPFALSFLYLLSYRIIDSWAATKRHGVFFEIVNGQVRIDWGGFDPTVSIENISKVLDQLRTPVKGNE